MLLVFKDSQNELNMDESSSVEDNATQRLIMWFYSTLVCSERQYV